jgi:DNA-binding response OmpR family regulator
MNSEPTRSSGQIQASAHIIVVDDEPAARLSLAELLSLEGYEVSVAASGEEAVELLSEGPFDLAIVDVKMPGMDGLEVVEVLQKQSPDTVIIMLTAHGTLETAVQAMRQGAHDYLLKPANVNEIMASVKAGLDKYRSESRRRELLSLMQHTLAAITDDAPAPNAVTPVVSDRFLQVREVLVDQQKHLATLRGEALELTPTEYKLLVYLLSHPDRVLSPQELVSKVQGYEADHWEARSIIRVHIRRLRQKLEPDPANPEYIVTVRGAGYMFPSQSSAP